MLRAELPSKSFGAALERQLLSQTVVNNRAEAYLYIELPMRDDSQFMTRFNIACDTHAY